MKKRAARPTGQEHEGTLGAVSGAGFESLVGSLRAVIAESRRQAMQAVDVVQVRLMAEIDQVIEQHGGWPGASATSTATTQETGEAAHD